MPLPATSIRAGPTFISTPCLTAFSASEISIGGGQRVASRSGAAATPNASRGMRAAISARLARTLSNCAATVASALPSLHRRGIVARRSSTSRSLRRRRARVGRGGAHG